MFALLIFFDFLLITHANLQDDPTFIEGLTDDHIFTDPPFPDYSQTPLTTRKYQNIKFLGKLGVQEPAR